MIFGDYQPEDPGNGQFNVKAGWQKATITAAEEGKAQSGNAMLTLSAKTETGAELKYAYRIVAGNSFFNRHLSAVLAACKMPVKAGGVNGSDFVGRAAEVYIDRQPNGSGKSYWAILNWAYIDKQGQRKQLFDDDYVEEQKNKKPAPYEKGSPLDKQAKAQEADPNYVPF